MAESRDDEECSSECYDSENCGSSCCSGSDSEPPFYAWLEKVGPRGELLYIEPDLSLQNDQNPNVPGTEDLYHSAAEQRNSKLNPAEKFKKWMKKRERKVRKSFPLLKQNKLNENINSGVLLDPFFPVSFRDVCIDVDSSRQNLGRRVSLSEELLGLELGLFDEMNNAYMESKIKILGFVPGREIADIKPGDWLRSINDVNVNINNIDDVLKELLLPTRVKLTISSPLDETFVQNKNMFSHETIIDELLGDSNILHKAKSQFLYIPHGIFYLVLEDKSIAASEGVVYKYPEVETPLFQLKGMFITLSHMISEISSPPLLSCSVTIQGELVHVGFVKEENETFVLALPASCSTVSEVQYFVTSLVKLLKFQFSSLKLAFEVGNISNHLNNFFILFFKHYLCEYSNPRRKSNPHLLEVLPSVQWLPLPVDIKTEVDDILSELESADFGSSSEGFDGNQRIYGILGSCLFYKGYLLGNHLPKQDLLDIHLFLHFNRILLLTRIHAISEIIIWKEVFPSRHQEKSFSDLEFVEVQGRYFMLIVAMNHCILTVLLEAGGCALRAEGHPPPEPFYVEEVQNTLIILHDCGIMSAIEKMMHQCLPAVASPYSYLKDSSLMKSSFSSIFSNTVNSFSLYKNMKSAGQASNNSSIDLEKGPADGESDVDSSYSDVSNENSSGPDRNSRSYSISAGSTTESQGSGEFSNQQAQMSQRTISSASDLNCLHPEYENCSFESTLSLVAGCENTLFQYLHMDPVEGIFLSPIHDVANLLHESVLKNIWDKFHECCLSMRTVFARSLRNKEVIKAATVTKYGVNRFLCNAYEQGVLFYYTQKDGAKLKSSLCFWVIGRLFFSPEPRELYVCYHDSTHQDIVEIAFRLGFGLSL